MTYVKHDTVPAYEFSRWDGKSKLDDNPPLARWGGKTAPPDVGSKIHVTMNGLGPATVRGYFVEHGWLGLLCEFHNPPTWWVKQNAPNRPLGHIFGIEFKVS